MMFSDLKELFGIISAAIALLTAWVGYRAITKKANADLKTSSKVLKILDPSIRQRPWKMRWFKWLLALWALPALIYGIYGLFVPAIRSLAVVNLIMAAGSILFIAFMRTEPPSMTMKSANIVLQMPMTDAMQSCLAAVNKLGAKVGRFDAIEGILVAKNGMSWRSVGEIITIRADVLDKNSCQVNIESDVIQVTVLLDFGANASNIRRIKEELLET